LLHSVKGFVCCLELFHCRKQDSLKDCDRLRFVSLVADRLDACLRKFATHGLDAERKGAVVTDAAVDGNHPDELLQREIVPDVMDEIC
jgi:hypothetical protein